VLHAAPYLWSGAGSVITRLIESQQGRHAVGVITSPGRRELRNWPAYDRRIARSGAWRRRIDLFHRDDATFWTAVSAMRQAIEEFEPDVLHTHAGTPTGVAILARSASSRPEVPIVAHFYSWGLGRPQWMNDMDLWAFGRADAAICSARAYREILRTGGVRASRLRLIPWGLSQGTRPRTTLRREQVIGTLGRIERRKGQLDLVRAFARVRLTQPDARLEIVGPIAETAYADQIRAAIAQLGLRRAVTLTGHVDDPARVVRRWSAYVSLSCDEGQGLAVLEAMSLGVPVVALRAPGIEDFLVDGHTGLCANRKTPNEISTLVSRLLDDHDLSSRVASKAAAMVRRRYSWQRTVQQIDALYRQVERF